MSEIDTIIATIPGMFPAGVERNLPLVILPQIAYDWIYEGSDDKKSVNYFFMSALTSSHNILKMLYNRGITNVIIIDKEPGFVSDYTTGFLQDLGFNVTVEKYSCFYEYWYQHMPSTVEYVTTRYNPAALLLDNVSFIDMGAPDVIDSLEVALELQVTGGVNAGKPYDWALRKKIKQDYYSALLSVLWSLIQLESLGVGVTPVYDWCDMLEDECIARYMYAHRHMLVAYGYDVAYSENLEDYVRWVETNLTSDLEKKKFIYKLTMMARGEVYIPEITDPEQFIEKQTPTCITDFGQLARILVSTTLMSNIVYEDDIEYIYDYAMKPYWIDYTDIERLQHVAFIYALTGSWIYGPDGRPLTLELVKPKTETYGPFTYTVDVYNEIISRGANVVEAIGSQMEIPRKLWRDMGNQGKTLYYSEVDDPWDAVVYINEKAFATISQVRVAFIAFCPLDLYPIIPFAKVNNVPVLLNPPSNLHPSVSKFLHKKQVELVYLVGNEAQWMPTLLDQIGALGINYEFLSALNPISLSLGFATWWIDIQPEIILRASKPRIVTSPTEFEVTIIAEKPG